MLFNICTNLTNGAGLERDYFILRSRLEALGHRVNGVMFNDPAAPPVADVNVFLEVVMPIAALGRAKQNWLVPNSEWWSDSSWGQYLPLFQRVLCKTRDGERIWRQRVADRCRYVGWEARDLFDPMIERQPRFLHVAGKSETKNTATIAEAWRRYRLPQQLTVVAFNERTTALVAGIPNVRHIHRLTDVELKRVLNEHLFHLIPSQYEGYGHYIHEALGCGGVVITTDAPPMNEFVGIARELLIRSIRSEPRAAARMHHVDSLTVANIVRRATELRAERLLQLATVARDAFLTASSEFYSYLKNVVDEATNEDLGLHTGVRSSGAVVHSASVDHAPNVR